MHDDDPAKAARSLLRSASDRVSKQSPHLPPLAGSALSRYQDRAAAAEPFYRRASTEDFVRDQPATVLADAWHGLHLWTLLEATRFSPLAQRLDQLLNDQFDIDMTNLVRRHQMKVATGLAITAIERKRGLSASDGTHLHDQRFVVTSTAEPANTAGESMKVASSNLDDEDYEDDPDWGGVSGPASKLADELNLAEHYPEQYGGGELVENQTVYEVGWKGSLPTNVLAFLVARGQADWVKFYPVPYNQRELSAASLMLMYRLSAAHIECHSAFVGLGCTAAVVTFYDQPEGTMQRAQTIASEVSARVGLPTEVIATTEPRLTSLLKCECQKRD